MQPRIRSGIPELDRALGGGLLPGSLTLMIGATGVGKSQLGMHFCEMGAQDEGHPGAIIDLSSRGDSQNHDGYAERLFRRHLSFAHLESPASLAWASDSARPPDVMTFLGYGGRRVLRSQLDTDQWHAWQSELNRRLPLLFRFVYGHLVHGTRRFVVDGIEPQTASGDSLQLELLELIYHRMLRQEHDWLAREVFREKFRENSAQVTAQAYDFKESVALVLVTSRANMLQELMTSPLADGDLAAAANTVIVLGRQWADGEMGRGLYIVKHRGSYAAQDILPFRIDERGICCG